MMQKWLWIAILLVNVFTGCVTQEFQLDPSSQESIISTRESEQGDFDHLEYTRDRDIVDSDSFGLEEEADEGFEPPALPCPPQSACDDGDLCTYDDHCEETGQRCVGTPISCVSSSCIDRQCNGTSACQESYTTNICDDGEACTFDDQCRDGICRGTSISCNSTDCILRSCNGTSSCREEFPSTSCDDGEACTYNDQCRNGICRGTSITCTSSQCVQRSCNGTSSCREDFPTTSCNDGEACTYNDQCRNGICRGTTITCPASTECTVRYCDGTSTCAIRQNTGMSCGGSSTCHPKTCNPLGDCVGSPVSNGTSCGGSATQRCCGGQCVDLSTDEANCGGCGIACAEDYACNPYANSGICRCLGYGHCYGPTPTCHNSGTGPQCNCQSDADCASGQSCQRVEGPNYCIYP